MMTMEIKGANEVIANLSHFSDGVSKKLVVACQMSQAQVVSFARLLCPVRTGNLRNSIQPGAVEISDTEVSADVEARMEYASFVEYGTRRMRAQPYLTPALLSNIPKFRENVQKALGFK
jgi:HK97 gp10 family phage protein